MLLKICFFLFFKYKMPFNEKMMFIGVNVFVCGSWLFFDFLCTIRMAAIAFVDKMDHSHNKHQSILDGAWKYEWNKNYVDGAIRRWWFMSRGKSHLNFMLLKQYTTWRHLLIFFTPFSIEIKWAFHWVFDWIFKWKTFSILRFCLIDFSKSM